MHFTTAEKSKNHSFSFVKDELKRQNRWSHKSVKKHYHVEYQLQCFRLCHLMLWH